MPHTIEATARWEPPPPSSSTDFRTTVKRRRGDDYYRRTSSPSLSLERGYPRSNRGYMGDDFSFRNHTFMRDRDSRHFDRSNASRSGAHRNEVTGRERRSPDRNFASRSRVYWKESWECQECFAFNESNQACCTRCGSKVQDSWSRASARDCRRRYGDRRERDKRRDSSAANHIKPPPKIEWPPLFETSGAAYVFDVRSGFFYEAASDFFYDPKTKLYYGNKQRTYFTYVAEEDPPFRPISNDTSGVVTKKNDAVLPVEKFLPCPSHTSSATSGPETSAITAASEAGKADKHPKAGKVKIAIRLKKKGLGFAATVATKSGSGMGATAAAAVKIEAVPLAPLIRKRYAANMEKWSERVQEMKREVTETPLQPKVTPSLNPKEQPDATSNLLTTSTHGKPACLLCKRKFANMEKLKQHIELSALHKQNLRKQAAADAKKESETNYRDRAKERRAMYGPEPSSIHEDNEPVIIGPSLTQARTVTVTETVTPDQALGETNIGNKLLQKLGWKNTENESGGSQLKQDWQAIEAIARGIHNVEKTNEKGIGSTRRIHRY